MITLAHLRSLLERALTHTENHAIVRLPEGERTVLGLCINYIGGEVAVLLLAKRAGERRWANLSEPTRARALLVALALALGLDPGVGGLGVQWTRFMTAWQLEAGDRFYLFLSPTGTGDDELGREAATVAAEPDPLKALVLAALHVLEHP